MNEDNILYITDDSGEERAMEIVLNFQLEDTGCRYVLLSDPEDENGDIFAFLYDDDGNLTPVEDEETLTMCSEVLDEYFEEDE